MIKKNYFPIFLLLLFPIQSFGWGAAGHTIVTQTAVDGVETSTLLKCGVTKDELVAHTNDPDKIWRMQRWKYRHEAQAHYFHVNEQPSDWKSRSEVKDRKKGFLVYRIVDWISEAKLAKKSGKTAELKEKLYGLTHYIGDLGQPLHVFSDHDGVEAGIPGVHSQFETKMVNAFSAELTKRVRASKAGITTPITEAMPIRNLVFDTAELNSKRAPELLTKAKLAVEKQKSKNPARGKKERFRFVKKKLYSATGDLATEQMAKSAALLRRALNEICN